MIRLYSGDDTFESYTTAFKEAKNLAKTLNYELKIINADELNKLDEFLQEIEGVGMFSANYVIFAKRLLKNKVLSEFLVENFERMNNYEIIIWEDSKADSRLKLIKTITKNKSSFNFNLPKEWQMNKWVEQISKAKKVNLKTDQINYIVSRLSTNKWQILNEINKLKLYLEAEKKDTLELNELEQILGFNVNGDIWKFLDFFGNKKKKEMILEFEKINKYESNIQYLIAMIGRELNLLFKVLYGKEQNLDSKAFGLHPFVLQKTLSKAKNFTKDEVIGLVKKLTELDFKIKSGDIDEVTALSLYLIKL